MHQRHKSIGTLLFSLFFFLTLTLLSGSVALAQGITETTIGTIKAAAPDQKFTVSVQGHSFSLTMQDMNAIPVMVETKDDGSVACALTDVTALNAWLDSIDAILAQTPVLSAGTLYYDPQTMAFTTMGDASYYKISHPGRIKVLSLLQEQLPDQSGAEKIATLSAEDLELVAGNIPEGFVRYTVKGSCTTDFSGSSSNRVNNIAIAAGNINRMVILPGQTVSMNEAFGTRSAANGYKMAGVYFDGKTIPGIGGGICQVSSTVYNAAMNSGMTLVERHPHSMPVHYLPLGMDAAISAGSKDLKFRNDFSFPVVLEAYLSGNALTVNLYTDEAQMAGLGYQLHAVNRGGRSAATFLELSVNGMVVEDRYIGLSKYK